MVDLISQKCKTCPKSTSPQQFVHKPLWARSLGAAGTQPDRILFGIMMIMMMVTIIMMVVLIQFACQGDAGKDEIENENSQFEVMFDFRNL